MKNAEKIAALPLVAVFLLVVYAVPVTQAVIELRRGGRVQAFDLLVDAFATPVRGAAARHADAAKFSRYLDTLSALLPSPAVAPADREKAGMIAEELLFTAEDLRKKAIVKNRHVRADSLSPAVIRLDSLHLQCSRLLSGLTGAAPPASYAENLAALRRGGTWLEHEYRRPSLLDAPLLVLRNLRFIFWNDRYLRPYEKEMENSSLFACSIRPQMFLACFLLFRDLGEKGILGRNGWFFYKQDVDFLIKPSVSDRRSVVVDPNDRPVSDDPRRAITRFKEQLGAQGIDLLLVIVHGKPSIYPDLAASRMSPAAAGSFSHSLRMLADLNKNGVETVDLFTPFARERLHDRESRDSLYLREDTHWKNRAVQLAARIIAGRVRQYPWFKPGTADYVLDPVTIERIGDIGTMAALPLDKVRGRFGLFVPEQTLCCKVFSVSRDAHGAETGRVPYKDDFRSSAILILGDSFSRIYQTDEPRAAGWISHLAKELAQPVASLVNDGGASTLVRQSLARKPDLLKGRKLVIWEIVERDFRYGEEGWKDVPLTLGGK